MDQTDLIVQGFRAGAVKSGIRGKDRLDLALIVSDVTATAAGVFTRNLVKAAPVLLDIERLQAGTARAIMINSGVANACTGKEGMALAMASSGLAAEALSLEQEQVLVASTGVIGEQLDLGCFEKGLPSLASQLSPAGFPEVAQAMMTTDTVPKTAVRTVALANAEVTLLGLAKGAGMIMPNMATMLAFVVTDAAIDSNLLRLVLRTAVDQSFNSITVDGDTSTNDSVLVLANGLAGNVPIDSIDSADGKALQTALNDLLKDLALQIVTDGEGATKLVTIRVNGAASVEEARLAACTVANSPLVKTAFFGEDANWGRIIAALGRSGAGFDPELVDIAFDDVFMVQDGVGQGVTAEEQATAVLKKKEFTVLIDLHAGEASAEYYTCDFSLDYVKINADYRT